ncbi:hypothetical protein [Paenibacillus xerothermodurans]|uniref:RCK C-terminal domain-containing protein n=1 Tax=Paenibacillus xerothermodurans TaxID=1977292 RepID=A0A2W1NS12_PAEXE|nr:hypothetical protein [Paenibacillus xerothermodurans]PZE22345.1 hypothetical protein CBW46_000715 [Paenibacillus xerothermodurans]
MLFIVIYMLLVILVLEIAASLLIISGLKKEIARFQAISMLTATGFTTKESELILRHPLRRSLAMFLILFGVFSLAVLISTITSMMQQNFKLPQLVTITSGLAILLLLVRTKKVNEALTRSFHRRLEQDFETHELPIAEVLYTSQDDLFTAVEIFEDSDALGLSAHKMLTPEQDIELLLIERGNHKIRRQCKDMEIQEGDILLVYGSKSAIENKFHRELQRMRAEMENEQLVAEM